MREREESCNECWWVVLLGYGSVDPESFLANSSPGFD